MLLHNRIDLRPSFAFAPRWCSSFKYNRSRPKKFYCIRHVFATRWPSSFVSSLETKKFYCILEESCRNCVVLSKFPSSNRHIVIAISSCRESTRVSSTINQCKFNLLNYWIVYHASFVQEFQIVSFVHHH